MIGLGNSHSLTLGASRPLESFVGPLDGHVTGLAGAWSVVRRLLSSYLGALIRVRRSSDGAEMDIGFTAAGWLDVVALMAFCGSSSAYVVIIYDQNAAHGHDQNQVVAMNQMRIVNAGTLEVGNNGKAMAHAVSFGQFINSKAPTVSPNATVLAVVNGVDLSARFAGSGNGIQRNELVWQSGIYFANAIFLGNSTGVTYSATAVVAWKMAGASDRRWQFDGGTEVADNGGTLANVCGVSGWFCQNPGGGAYGAGIGKMSELITFSRMLSEAEVQTIQAGQGGLN